MRYNDPMRRLLILTLLFYLSALPGLAQRPEAEKNTDQPPANSPARLLKFQHDEIKKWSARLTELATEVEEELDKHGENVLPLGTLKKLEEIEKLARKMRSRLKQ